MSGKGLKLWFDDQGVAQTEFYGDWTGRDAYVALRAVEKGYRRYQAERRRAPAKAAMEENKEGGEGEWIGGSTSSGSRAETTTAETSDLVKVLTRASSTKK